MNDADLPPMIRQGNLLGEIALTLAESQTEIWDELSLYVASAGGITDRRFRRVYSGNVQGPRVPRAIGPMVKELRSVMYSPGKGTWFEMEMIIPREGRARTLFNYDREPANNPQFSPGAYALDQRLFPRDIQNQPDWLRSRIADGLIEIESV